MTLIISNIYKKEDIETRDQKVLLASISTGWLGNISWQPNLGRKMHRGRGNNYTTT